MRFLKLLAWEVFDITSFLIFIAGVVLFIWFFIFNPFTVVGSSMMTTIHNSDILIVDKITSKFHGYQRGDIIVFVPQGKQDAFIKRIVWLPGETVIIQNGGTYLCPLGEIDREQCEKLDETYLDSKTNTLALCSKNIFDVDEEWYFVMWDNRQGSTDSRCCFGGGCTETTPYLARPIDIIGRASLRILPFQTLRTF